MIRPATPDDIGALAGLGRDFYERSGLTEFDYVEADCAASLATFMALPNFVCLIHETGRINGAIGGITCPVYFNKAHMSGEELFWWMSPGSPPLAGIRLLESLENEVRMRGCVSWQMKSIDRLNGAAMGRLYARRGYGPLENSFIKRL